jgi:hypothetical protein
MIAFGDPTPRIPSDSEPIFLPSEMQLHQLPELVEGGQHGTSMTALGNLVVA